MRNIEEIKGSRKSKHRLVSQSILKGVGHHLTVPHNSITAFGGSIISLSSPCPALSLSLTISFPLLYRCLPSMIPTDGRLISAVAEDSL
jgi:hypothetical protein